MIKYAAIKVNKTGEIYEGTSHASIMRYRDEDCRLIITDPEDIIRGFTTGEGVFVSREEAAKIAFECGQVKELKPMLYSYDIFGD